MQPIIVSRGGEFAPDWRDNLERKPEDQIIVTYRYLTAEEQQRIYAQSHRAVKRTTDDDDEDTLTEIVAVQWVKEAQAMIESISGLAIQDGDEVIEIETGDDLFAQRDPELVELSYVVLAHVRNAAKVDKKKLPSEPPSGSKDSRKRKFARK